MTNIFLCKKTIKLQKFWNMHGHVKFAWTLSSSTLMEKYRKNIIVDMSSLKFTLQDFDKANKRKQKTKRRRFLWREALDFDCLIT